MITTSEGEPLFEPWTARPFSDVLAELLAATGRHDGRPAVLAVDGRSGSGKSTITDRITAAIPGAVTVHSDDVAWWESFFRWDHLMASGILEPVRRGESVSFRPPAWDTRQREGSIDVAAGRSLVVVEGVGVSRRSLEHLIDAAVWVQCDAFESRRRGIERDALKGETESFWDEWEAEESPFMAEDRPWERADLVICGTPHLTRVPFDPCTEVVVGSSLRW